MIVFVALGIGAAWGAFLAKRRKGNVLDMLQYAAGFGILFAIVAMALTIGLERAL